jgi:hypothetical protein
MPAKRNIIGLTFGRGFVFAAAGFRVNHSGRNIYRSWVRCACGTEFITDNWNLTSGHTKSCGCWNDEQRTKHGQTTHSEKSRIYEVWSSMKQRCTNPNCHEFKYYGERGITLCPEWYAFEPFFSFMGPGKKGWSIHRIDNDVGYFPENMVWATQRFQMRHMRRNRILTVKGFTGCAIELCEHFGIRYPTVWNRLVKHGWSIEDAFTKPIQGTVSPQP